MDISKIFYIPTDILTNPAILIGITAILIGAISVPMAIRRMRKRKEPADLYAIVIDKQHRKITKIPFIKLADRIYAALKEGPLFLYMPGRIHSYTCWFNEKVPCVMGYKRGYLVLPFDPMFAQAVHALMNVEELAEIPRDDISKMISYIYGLQEKLIGHIKISPKFSIAIAFDLERLLTEYFDKVADDASEAIQHFFAMSRNYQTFQKYVESVTRVMEAKYVWMRYLIPLLIAFGIMWIMIGAFMR